MLALPVFSQSENESDPKARLTAIYGDVRSAYNASKPDTERLNETYLTSPFKMALKAIASHGASALDWDFWIMGQEWSDLAFEVTKVAARGNKARCIVKVYNNDDVTTCIVMMNREGGKWLIDDFISDSYVSVRQTLQEFIISNSGE